MHEIIVVVTCAVLKAQTVPLELVRKTLGPEVVVGPITTIEPRRRKFHRAITVTIPLPKELKSHAKINTDKLRLLCSITGKSHSHFVLHLYVFS